MQIKSKCMQIVDDIIMSLEKKAYSPLDKIESESALIKKYGVSKVTIRRAIKILSDMKLVNTKVGIGTYVAENVQEILEKSKIQVGNPAKNRRKKIAVIMPNLTNFTPHVIDSIEEEASKYGYEICVYHNNNHVEETECINKAKRFCVGILITPIRFYNNYMLENYKKLEKSHMPFVMVGKPPSQVFAPCVCGNDVIGVYEAVMQMGESGLNQIIHVTNIVLDKQSVNERIEGYNLAIEQLGKSVKSEIIDISTNRGLNRLEDIIKTANEKIGLILYDDLMAPEIYEFAQKYNKDIIRDFSIVGYSNGPLCTNLVPNLSSIDVSHSMLGKWAVRLLDNIIAVKARKKVKLAVYEQINIRPILIRRETF